MAVIFDVLAEPNRRRILEPCASAAAQSASWRAAYHPEPPAALGLTQPLRSHVPDRILDGLGQIVTPRHPHLLR
jgi:hypothetical protein